MSNVTIFCDSCSSITKELASKLNVEIIPTEFQIGDIVYNPLSDDVIDYNEYYERLENKEMAKTSCINPNVLIEYFKPFLEKGNEIIYITLSSGLSASYNNAILAKNILADEFNNDIQIIDSMTGSLGIHFDINEAVRLRDLGLSAKEILDAIDKNKLNITSLFTIGSLDHLRRGGRLSKISAVVGTLLHINPIITTDELGKLVEFSKFRGRKKATNSLIDLAINNAKEGSTIYIAYTNCEEEALKMKEQIENNSNFKCFCGFIDYTMGAHCGPKTIAVFYQNK